MYNSFLLVVFISFIIQEGESIKCYVCDSEVNPYCADGTEVAKKLNATRCNYDSIPERKRFILGITSRDEPVNYNCLKYNIIKNGNKSVVRECTRAKTRQIDPCYHFKVFVEGTNSIINANIIVDSCEVCIKDYCNGGVPAASSSVTSSVLLFCLVMFSVLFGA